MMARLINSKDDYLQRDMPSNTALITMKHSLRLSSSHQGLRVSINRVIINEGFH